VFLLEARLGQRDRLRIAAKIILYSFALVSIAFNLLKADALRASVLTDHGNIEMSLQHWAKASTYYRRALRLYPKQIAIMTDLGHSYVAEGKLTEARELFERASFDYPESAEAHLNYAWVLFQMKQFNDAAAQCQRALDLNPGMESAKRGMQDILAARDRAP
jgi:Tfp pilus assembly protein PilF